MTDSTGHSPVVDTSRSPRAGLRPVPVSAVRLEDGVWAPRRERNRTVTLPQQYEQCEATGRLDNFRRAAGQKDGPFQGRFFNDSDVYKWLEAVAWTLATDDDPDLRRRVDEVVALVAAAQDADGYLNTFFTFEREPERWTDLGVKHELYCAGHLFQAAVAHRRATGDDTLMRVALRLAEHIDDTFGPGKRQGTCGHPEVEMALVELARETGAARWLRLATFFLDQRGHHPSTIVGGPGPSRGPDYFQDHLPLRDQHEVVGHAVRALYLYAGATDAYAETGDETLRPALGALWRNLQTRKSYVTGGAGARHEGEAFGEDYELPNAAAYAETCAAIAHAMWAWRRFLVDGEATAADAMETALLNGVLSGLSLDGEEYFYVNPLADDGRHRRQPWFGTACCPPNIARLLASLPGYLYALAGDEIRIPFYAANTASLTLPDGRSVELRQRTRYPWDGDVEIEVRGEGEFALALRVPSWCVGAALALNGSPLDAQTEPGTFATVRRTWRPGDVLRLDLPMPPRRLESHPRVVENTGRVALVRGPLVYCLEAVDNPDLDPRDLLLPADEPISTEFRPDLLGGVAILAFDAVPAPPGPAWDEALYHPAGTAAAAPAPPARATAIPY
ncbi:MAG: glycoside hydrolase family 127 protein, partial [Chloroflexota bacterium]|nr:glycoside hydrolase family 127 protein [Chloroflexota bacterium]